MAKSGFLQDVFYAGAEGSGIDAGAIVGTIPADKFSAKHRAIINGFDGTDWAADANSQVTQGASTIAYNASITAAAFGVSWKATAHTNVHFGIRVPIADKPLVTAGRFRLAGITSVSTAWQHVTDGTAWAYYQISGVTLAGTETISVQKFDPLIAQSSLLAGGGTAGQVLTKTADGQDWRDAQGGLSQAQVDARIAFHQPQPIDSIATITYTAATVSDNIDSAVRNQEANLGTFTIGGITWSVRRITSSTDDDKLSIRFLPTSGVGDQAAYTAALAELQRYSFDNNDHRYDGRQPFFVESVPSDVRDSIEIQWSESSPSTRAATDNKLIIYEPIGSENLVPEGTSADDGKPLVRTDDGPEWGSVETPERVNPLPTPAGDDGRHVFLEADYTRDELTITPAAFSNNTSLGGENLGTRGWYRSPDGYQLGHLLGDPNSIPEVVLISDTTVAVLAGNLTSLTALVIDIDGTDRKFPLTSGTKNTDLTGGPEEAGRKVDLWTVGANTDSPVVPFPTGNWDGLKLEGPVGTFYPSGHIIRKGDFREYGSRWREADYNTKRHDPHQDFKVLVSEEEPNTSTTKSILFVRGGTLYGAANPFPNILDLRFNGDSTDDDYRRYTVTMNSALAVGKDRPVTLRAGTHYYPLVPTSSSTAGEANFITPPVLAADGPVASRLTVSIDIEYASGIWAGGATGNPIIRTIDKDQLTAAVSGITTVTTFPTTPTLGQQVDLTVPQTLPGYAVLSAAAGTDHVAGFDPSHGSLLTVAGAAVPEVTNVVAYPPAWTGTNQATLRNHVFITFAPGGSTPTKVVLNGVDYNLTASVTGTYIWADPASARTIRAGERYAFNVEYTGGTKLVADVTYPVGRYEWDGIGWVTVLTAQVDIDGRIASWARAGQPEPDRHVAMTQAAYDALAEKDDNTIYLLT